MQSIWLNGDATTGAKLIHRTQKETKCKNEGGRQGCESQRSEEKDKSKLETEYAEDTMAISTWMWSLASKQAEDLFYDTVTPRSGETKPAPPGAVFK